MNAIILDSNLMLSTRIEKGLQLLGYEVRIASDATQLQAILEGDQPSLAVINYGDSSYDAIGATKLLGALHSPPYILGYVSHGEIPHLRPKAYAAGCRLLVANSAITTRLSQLVSRMMDDSRMELIQE